MAQIEQGVIDKLLSLYKIDLGLNQEASKLSKDAFNKACQFIEDNLPAHFDWEEINQSDKREYDELRSLLASCLHIVSSEEQEKDFEFDEIAARIAIVPIQQELADAKQIYLVRDVNSAGIQEKYLKSQLGSHESLTTLDIKRFILNTGMADKIHIANFSVKDIGAILCNERQKHTNDTKPYSIPLMVNLNGHMEGSTPKWASVIINVDPISRNVSYKMTSEEAVSEAQKKEVEDAIRFNVTIPPNRNYSAFPEAPTISGNVKTINDKTGKPSGGYVALHHLYQDEALANDVASNSKAAKFAKLEHSLRAIRNHVYEDQLSAIKLDPNLASSLNGQMQKNFHNGLIQPEALSQLFSYVGSSVQEILAQHPMVAAKLSELQIFHSKINFPGQKVDSPLSGSDYQLFLLLVNEKFKSTGIDKTLDELVIQGESAALEGLIAYNSSNNPLPFKMLTLDLTEVDLSDEKTQERFLFNLKSMLLTMSESGLPALKFIDPNNQLSANAVKEIAEFVQSRQVGIDISLPEAYQSSKEQRAIDEATSDYIRKRNLSSLDKKIVIPDDDTGIAKEVRKREKLGKQSLSVDVELQQEQQVEVAVESSTERSAEVGSPGSPGDPVVYNLEKFKSALQGGQLEKSSKSYLVSSSDTNVDKLWGIWFGHLSAEESKDSRLGLSKAACEELLLHHDQFKYGLDLKNLPPGFSMKTQGYNNFIDFDPNLKLISEYAPLQVQAKGEPKEVAITHAQFTTWLAISKGHPIETAWNDLNHGTYNKNAHQLFRQYLPQMLLLNSAQQNKLFELSFDKNGEFNTEKFQFLLENSSKLRSVFESNMQDSNASSVLNELFGTEASAAKDFISNYAEAKVDFADHLLNQLVSADPQAKGKIEQIIAKAPEVNLNGLLQVYIQSGGKGLDALNRIIDEDPALFNQLNKDIFAKNNSYTPLLDEKHQDAMLVIKGLTGSDRVWFETLLQQHCKAQAPVNLIDLVNAFKEFKEELKNIQTPDGMPLVLPEQCNLKNVKSLPTALSRIIELMTQVKEANRVAQWNDIASLDLSSNGAIKIMSNANRCWAFVTPEMQINAEHEIRDAKTALTAKNYKAPREWDNIGLGSPDLIERYYRYVAAQGKDQQLPLEFYRHAQQKIDNATNLLPEDKERLYILAASSTTSSNTATMKSLEEAKKDFDTLFDMLIKTPLPSVVPENAKNMFRSLLLTQLTELESAPPLPVVTRMILLISTCYATWNPATLIENDRKLAEAYGALKEIVAKYKDYNETCVYEGMKDYADADYKKGTLFFEHVATLKAMEEKFVSDPSIGRSVAIDLVRLISSFKLGADDFERLRTEIFQNGPNQEAPERQRELYSILRKFSAQNNKTVNGDDFLALCHAVNNSTDEVMDVVKGFKFKNGSNLVEYLPEEFVENYGKKGIPYDVEQLIASRFNESQQNQIKKMLLQFSGPTDNGQYKTIVEKIIGICEPLSRSETNIFISKLTSSQGLFTNVQPLDDVKNPFVRLLDYISRNNATDDFINLIAAERNLLRNTPDELVGEFFVETKPGQYAVANLDEKAILYLETILPAMRDFKNPNVSQVDITPRVLDVLLKTPTEQLTSVSTVVRPETPYFNQQQAELQSILKNLEPKKAVETDKLKEIIEGFKNQIDFAGQIESVEDFIQNSGVEDTTVLQSYKEKLEEINAREFSAENAMALANNPAFLTLAVYLVSPESMSEEERELFEKRYQDKLTALIEKHPSLALNKDLINHLLFNSKFLNELGKGEALEAAKSPDLLEDDAKLAAFVEALDKDLKGIATFRDQTKDAQKELTKQQKELGTYPKVFDLLYQKIDKIAGENPNSKKQFLDLFDHHLQNYSPEKNGELLNYLNDFVDVLGKSFAKTADKNIVLSLCLQFNSDDDEELTPERLVKLLETVNELPDEHQSIVLKAAVALINNEKDYNFKEFKQLCDMVKASPKFAETLVKLYAKAPFPDCAQAMQMHKIATGTGDRYDATMEQIVTNFGKHPCQRDPRNGFKPEHAEKQLAKFEINGHPPTDQEMAEGKVYFQKFHQITMDMREKSIDELLKILESYKGKDPKKADYDTLVAAAAELLHRSKGQDGNSMEINTTQYMAILTSMKTPGHVTSEIGTGEGKSRIMMISLACQYAMGNTVDFVTSDAQLATRDYVEFQAYFELIGAKTSMIFAGSDPSQYQKGGINFSDPSNLSLFRNKARSLGQGDLVIDSDPKKRALLLDEADKTYFDVADTRFNFSKEGDESIQGMQWVYPLLMDYFSQESFDLKPPIDGKHKMSPIELYYADIDVSREKFIQFASGNCTASQLMRLKALSNAQIEQWQVSAVTASQLKFKEDFVIEPDTLISTPNGPKISSEGQLLFGNRVSKSSKFSFGVHQCLHARLNLARQNPSRESDPLLRDELAKCEQAFYVPDEKQIVYSTTSKNLLDDYDEGTLKAVTGTAGSILEREEAREFYGEGATKMQFIDVPRDKGLNRRDKAIQLTKNEHQQFKVLVEQIKEARAKNQPILIIAENDEESLKLFEKLNKVFKEDLQHVHSQLSLKDEKSRIDIAGRPGQITVSTDMIGRGTDIALKDAAKKHGLNVMLTYLPRVRDLEQIIGRAGRFGAEGDTSLVIDKQRLKKQLGKEALGAEYYHNAEAYIEREQAIMDRNKQCERLIKNSVGDFRKTLTDNFFEDMLRHVDQAKQKKLTPAWTAFFDKSDKAWNEQWPRIQKELQEDTIDINKVQAHLDEYRNSVQKAWAVLQSNVKDIDADCAKKLNADVPKLELNETTKKLITDFDINKYSAASNIVYDHYSPGHDGRSVKYSHWSIPVIATLKGLANLIPFVHFEDARKPFADLRAWANGTGKVFPDASNVFESIGKFIRNIGSGIASIFKSKGKETNDESLHKSGENGSYRKLFETGILDTDSVMNHESAKAENAHKDEKEMGSSKQFDGPEPPAEDENLNMNHEEQPEEERIRISL
ncbi:MAG: hypothetical protein P4L79_01950 [Legionella sp.]|uniref:preprotein translocase subunit SecA n=1 Tax=Legionella sp. TaxID=459 RepID=UPI0028473F8A|nr:hypothetical protein [Legionella sp.]